MAWDFAESSEADLALGLLLPGAFLCRQQQYSHGELKHIKLGYHMGMSYRHMSYEHIWATQLCE